MDNKLKEIVKTNREELSQVPDALGHCFVASNNLLFDLENSFIEAEMLNIRDLALVNYDHYFVLAKADKRYLIDLTYSQFVSRDGESIRGDKLERWPSLVLLETEEGTRILNCLLSDGYFEVDDESFYKYLRSFNQKLEPFISLGDIIPIGRER